MAVTEPVTSSFMHGFTCAVTHAPVAEAVGVPYVPVDEALGALAGV